MLKCKFPFSHFFFSGEIGDFRQREKKKEPTHNVPCDPTGDRIIFKWKIPLWRGKKKKEKKPVERKNASGLYKWRILRSQESWFWNDYDWSGELTAKSLFLFFFFWFSFCNDLCVWLREKKKRWDWRKLKQNWNKIDRIEEIKYTCILHWDKKGKMGKWMKMGQNSTATSRCRPWSLCSSWRTIYTSPMVERASQNYGIHTI